MKNKKPFQVFDLGLQVGYINPQRIQLIEEYRDAIIMQGYLRH